MELGPDLYTTLSVALIPLLYLGVYGGFAVYVLLLLRRLVRGTERIANALEGQATRADDDRISN